MLKNIRNYLKDILTGKRPLVDVWYYIQGHTRKKLYYSKFSWIIRKHIKEQIKLRFKVIKEECYFSGSCQICGCSIPALLMSSKSCHGNCYPPLVSKKEWNSFKDSNIINYKNKLWRYNERKEKFTSLG